MMTCERFLNAHGPRVARDLLATIPADTGVDYYGVGGAVTALEERVATLLGKPAACSCRAARWPNRSCCGSTASAAARRAWRFTLLPPRHAGGAGLPTAPRPLRHTGRPSQPAALGGELELVHEPLGALLIELPQREPRWHAAHLARAERPGRVGSRARGRRAPRRRTHLGVDLPTTESRSPRSRASSTRSTCRSTRASAASPAAASWASRTSSMKSRVWRTRHGGRLFGMWPYAASALTVLETRLPRMGKYYRHAVAISKALEDLPGVEVLPSTVQSSMMHLRLTLSPRGAARARVRHRTAQEDLDLRPAVRLRGRIAPASRVHGGRRHARLHA